MYRIFFHTFLAIAYQLAPFPSPDGEDPQSSLPDDPADVPGEPGGRPGQLGEPAPLGVEQEGAPGGIRILFRLRNSIMQL